MHTLDSFFLQKSNLDSNARAEGKTCALPAQLLPLLAISLKESIAKNDGVFRGLPEQHDYLLNAARIMAIFAVWEYRCEWIELGILALLNENAQVDGKLSISYLAMLNHAASKIGEDFNKISQALVCLVDSDAGELLRSFNARSTEGKLLENFGYKEINRNGKFDFKCII